MAWKFYLIMKKHERAQHQSEIERLKSEIERLKEVEEAINYLLKDPDVLFRTDVLIRVIEYKRLRKASRSWGKDDSDQKHEISTRF